MRELSTILTALSLVAACGSEPDTSQHPECVGGTCGDGLECCRGLCQPVESICADEVDATSSDAGDTRDTAAGVDATRDTAPEVDDTSDTAADTGEATADADTSDGGLVLVDPGIHNLGGASRGAGLLLLDARLDGRSRVCAGDLCLDGGVVP
jgi:hypothetical protein